MTATVLLIYSLISGTVLTVLWATFRLSGMKSLTHHRLNRALLVGILLASALLPVAAFMERPAEPAKPITVNVSVGEIAPIAMAPETETPPAPSGPSKAQIWAIASTVYIIGAIASTLWLLIGLGNIGVAIAKGERRKLDRTTTLVIHERDIVPFTWGRWIVISRADLEENGDVLLCHELAHKSAVHWADLLLSRAVTCVDWYWPSAWLLTRNLAAVHEYQADSRVLAEGTDAASYQMLLIRKGASGVLANIANPFNYSSLKNRITMMQKKLSPSKSRMRALALLPAAALVLLISTSPILASVVAEASPSPDPISISDELVMVPSMERLPLTSADTVMVVTATPTPEIPMSEAVNEEPADTAGYQNVYIKGVGTIGGKNLYKELLIINGVEFPMTNIKTLLDNKKVLSFSILKDAEQIARYGEKAEYGVIEVITEDAPEEMKQNLPARKPGEVTVERRTANADEKVYENPTEAPVFPGGESKLYEFLARNIRYPEEAVVNNVQGTVTVGFTIEKDGSLTEFRVLDNPTKSEALANESLRVAKLLPKFIPAKYEGKPVRFAYTLPISFKMR